VRVHDSIALGMHGSRVCGLTRPGGTISQRGERENCNQVHVGPLQCMKSAVGTNKTPRRRRQTSAPWGEADSLRPLAARLPQLSLEEESTSMRVAFGARKIVAPPGRGYCHKKGCPYARATSMDGCTRLVGELLRG